MADSDLDNCGGDACPSADCAWVFGRIRVRPTIRFGTWVEFQLHPQFADPGPYTYQLQVGHTGTNRADDWANVGLPVAGDINHLVDDTQRVYGKTQWTHYRIKLTTPAGVFYSTPMHCWGDLPFRFWRLVANRERQYLKQFQTTPRGQEGYLLKRRLVGETPEAGQGVIDYLTGEVVNPQAEETVGTEFVGGYYLPIPCIWADVGLKLRREQIELQSGRGTVNDGFKTKAVMLARPQLDSYDVWVAKSTDLRWEIHTIEHIEEISGVPVVVSCEFRLLPFGHPVYKYEIAGHGASYETD